MKFNTYIFSFVIGAFLVSSSQLEARDLTYKIGVGYSQVFSNSIVPEGQDKGEPSQFNALIGSYGIARDMQIGAFLGFQDNFDIFTVGPYFRYDVHRLLSRDFAAWNHLNIFVQTAFLVKAGDAIKTGLLLQAPYIGFEILPFSSNNFAIQTAAGVVVDLMEDNSVGFTNGIFGDLGVKYYF